MERFRNNDVYRSGIHPPLKFEGTTKVPEKDEYFGDYTAFEGNVYVNSGEYLFAVDAESKKIIWTKKGKDIGIVRDGIDGRIYLTLNDKASCLDSESGEIIWQYDEDGGFNLKAADYVYSEIIRGEKFFIGCHSQENGSLIWERPTLSLTSIMVENGVIVGYGQAGYRAIKEATGEILWHIEENEWLDTYFPHDSDKFRIHTAQGPFIYKNAGPLIDGVLYAGYGTSKNHGVLTAISALNGEVIWATEVKEYPQTRLFHNSKIYFIYRQGIGGHENYLNCVDAATGEHLYEIEENITPAGCYNPIIANNYFIGGAGPYLSFFDLEKKEFAWKYKLKNKRDIFTSPVYVYKDRLVAFDSQNSEIYWFRSRNSKG